MIDAFVSKSKCNQSFNGNYNIYDILQTNYQFYSYFMSAVLMTYI